MGSSWLYSLQSSFGKQNLIIRTVHVVLAHHSFRQLCSLWLSGGRTGSVRHSGHRRKQRQLGSKSQLECRREREGEREREGSGSVREAMKEVIVIAVELL